MKPLPTKQINTLKREFSKVVKGEAPYDKKAAMNYYARGLMANLTRPQANGSQLYAVRTTILKDLRTSSDRAPAVYQQLKSDVLSWCGSFVKPSNNYHPIAQYNAMLLIGSLNDKEAVLTPSNPKPPVPSQKALGILYNAIKKPE